MHQVLMYFKEVQVSLYLLVSGDEINYHELIMSKYFFKCTLNFKRNSAAELMKGNYLNKILVQGTLLQSLLRGMGESG